MVMLFCVNSTSLIILSRLSLVSFQMNERVRERWRGGKNILLLCNALHWRRIHFFYAHIIALLCALRRRIFFIILIIFCVYSTIWSFIWFHRRQRRRPLLPYCSVLVVKLCNWGCLVDKLRKLIKNEKMKERKYFLRAFSTSHGVSANNKKVQMLSE